MVPFALRFVARPRAVLVLSAAGFAGVGGNVVSGLVSNRIAQYALNGALCFIWAFAVDSYDVRTATLIAELFYGHHLSDALAGASLCIDVGGAAGPPLLARRGAVILPPVGLSARARPRWRPCWWC